MLKHRCMAVYTEVGDEDLVAFVAAYDIGAVLSCKGIAEGVENSNFALTTERGAYILTLYEKRIDADDLPFFLGLIEHLAAAGVPSPRPVHGRDGSALRELAGRPAAIVTFLSGMWPRRITAAHCTEVGRAMAGLHQAGVDFSLARPNGLGLGAWRPLLERCDPEADDLQFGLVAELDRELKVIEATWPSDLPGGVIHADMFPDNVFFNQGQVSGVIDFYFACNDAFAYDIAIALNAWCFANDGSFDRDLAASFILGYSTVRRLEAAEVAALPVLARGAAMRFLLTRLYDWTNTPANALVTRKHPMEYFNKLAFHAAATGPADYGF